MRTRFVGVGRIGRPMTHRLIRATHQQLGVTDIPLDTPSQ